MKRTDLNALLSFFSRLAFQHDLKPFKDVCAHCYCTSLVRTLHMTWRMPHHVFQAGAPSRNSTKYRADELCGNLSSKYFC